MSLGSIAIASVKDSEVKAAPALSRAVTLLFAVACGLAVANAYYVQPLLDAMADDFNMSHAVSGIVMTTTQIGYGLGLLLVVPLGDLLDRRRLIVSQTLLASIALLVVAFAPTQGVMLAGMAAVGMLAVVTQVLVAYAGTLAKPSERGQVVGVVTSGVIIGIMLARTVSGTLADLFGWRSVYVASAAATLIVAGLLFKSVPRQTSPSAHVPYFRLIGSVFKLFVEEPILRSAPFSACSSSPPSTCCGRRWSSHSPRRPYPCRTRKSAYSVLPERWALLAPPVRAGSQTAVMRRERRVRLLRSCLSPGCRSHFYLSRYGA